MVSNLQKIRQTFQPEVPASLHKVTEASFQKESSTVDIPKSIQNYFPHTHSLNAWRIAKQKESKKQNQKLRVGVLFSGGQAAGGHNVISGLFDGLRQIHPDCQLFGFLNGPSGLVENRFVELTSCMIDSVRNQGGFDLIGSGRTKIEKKEQFENAAKTAIALNLNTIVIIGGDDSNTNAAFLAEYFLANKVPTNVIGVPKTIDGDLRSADIEISFGFDSATKTYAELIGNIARDAISAKKYYHFIKLMGRSASHVTLECALLTHPNLALIGEERLSLSQIVEQVVDLIEERKKIGKDYGIVLLPEGLIEFIPEFQDLIRLCNQHLANNIDPQKIPEILTEPHRSFFAKLPEKIQNQILLERDPHGNVQVSQIETDVLLIELVKKELVRRSLKFSAINHFFGYEGRACLPTNFDANYCYSLGLLAALASRENVTGVILAIKNLYRPVSEWDPRAIPIVQLMNLEMRSGKEKPVIAKALVDLNGSPYQYFVQKRKHWKLQDDYQMPGPIQFFGPNNLINDIPISLTI